MNRPGVAGNRPPGAHDLGAGRAAAWASTALATRALAVVIYTAVNPARPPFPFVLFVYDSPTFITTDTVVPVADLAFANPMNTIAAVEFDPNSALFPPDTDEVAVFQSAGGPPQSFTGNQFRFYPAGTFTHYGVTPGDSHSFGFPSSELIVKAPEPSTIGLLGVGLFGRLCSASKVSEVVQSQGLQA